MFNMKTKNILVVVLLVFFVVSLTVSVASASKVVSLPALQEAAKLDPARAQGGTTPGAVDSVEIVEAALAEEGLLKEKYAYDGSYGTTTIKAYKKWQKSIGSSEQYCDGIPGKKDLTKLGKKYGFTVDTSTISGSDTSNSDSSDTELYVNLNVPIYKQGDSQWSDDKLGFSKKGSTIGSAGCAITSISMVLDYYGVQTNPKDLNSWLKENNGYSGGDVYWETAADISNGKVKFVGRYSTDLTKIKSELNDGHPVIAKVKSKKTGGPHFVVITGYSGSTYYINDPGSSATELSYYNKNPAKAIRGVRIYH